MVKISKFTPEQNKQISEAVRKAELGTVGEIVPMVVARSHRYRWVHFLWFLIGLLGASACLELCFDALLWHFSFHQILLWQLGGGVTGFLFSLIPWVHRKTVPTSMMAEAVHRNCLAQFVQAGLTETRGRSGILIFVSLFEHRVEILADAGIHRQVPKNYWKEQTDSIVQGVRTGQFVEALCRAISTMGSKLAEKFPSDEANPNELSNELRED